MSVNASPCALIDVTSRNAGRHWPTAVPPIERWVARAEPVGAGQRSLRRLQCQPAPRWDSGARVVAAVLRAAALHDQRLADALASSVFSGGEADQRRVRGCDSRRPARARFGARPWIGARRLTPLDRRYRVRDCRANDGAEPLTGRVRRTLRNERRVAAPMPCEHVADAGQTLATRWP